MPVISPDGTLTVYPAGEGPIDRQRLFFRHVDQLTTTALPGTEGAFMPFFSPDGRSVGFWAGNQLKTIRLDAAASPVVICAAGSFLGGAWAADGTIIFGSSDGLQRVGQDGGVPRPVTTANPFEIRQSSTTGPAILPGGRALLISVRDGDAPFRIDVLTLATGARRTVVARGSHAEYSPTGHIVYAAGDTLFGIPIRRRSTHGPTGAPVKLLDGVSTVPFTLDGVGGFALSATGTLVFRPQPPPAHRTLVWADRSGVTTPIPIEPRTFWTPRLSPDGRQFAVVVDENGRRNIWVYRFDNATFLPIASEGINRAPVWTRDGSRLAYLSERDGVRHLMSQPSDSSAAAESLLTSQNDNLFPGSWSADGRSLVYVDQPAPRQVSELRVLPIDGRQVATLPGIPANGNRPAISPDGRWLAFGIRVRPRHPGGQRSTYGRFQALGRHVNSSMPPASQCGAGTARRSFFAADAAGRRRLPATGSSKCLSIVRVGSRPGRNGSCSAKSSPKMRGLALPVTTSRLTVDSCWSSSTNRNPSRLTCTCCFTSTTSSDGASGSHVRHAERAQPLTRSGTNRQDPADLPKDITELLHAWAGGDAGALEELLPLVYADLRRRAGAYMRRERRNHTLEPTALVHEAYLKLVDQRRATWQNRGQFFGVASQMMRRILVDRARARRMAKRSGRWARVTLDDGVRAAASPINVDVLDLDAALTRLAVFDSRKCQLAELRFFGGLSLEEAGEALGISTATADRDWQTARAWLLKELRATP